MKLLLTSFLFLFAIAFCRAQDSIQLKHSSWAGGVCCNTGENFYMSIPKSIERKGFDSLWVYIPGSRIHVSAKLFSAENRSQATFGWAFYSEDESYSVVEMSYHGIVTTDVIKTEDWSESQCATVFLSNGKTKQVPVKYSVEFLAYP